MLLEIYRKCAVASTAANVFLRPEGTEKENVVALS